MMGGLEPRVRSALLAVGTVVVALAGCSVDQPIPPVMAMDYPGLHGVAFGGDQFVAVGDEGALVTSADGATWVPRSWGGYTSLNGVAYGGGQYVAVGSGGVVLTSTDGATWTTRPVPAPTRDLQAVAYGDGVWVAVGWSQVILTSTDGVTWTQVYSGLGVWQAVAYVGSAFVAVDRVGGVIVSVDAAVTWTLTVQGNQAGDTGYCGVLGGPGGEVLALDDGGELKVSASANGSTFSVEATLWSAITLDCALADDGDTYVAASDYGQIGASHDGKTWSILPGVQGTAIEGLAFDGQHLVGVGPDGTVLDTTCSGGTCVAPTVGAIEVPAPPAGAYTGGSSGGGSGSGSGGSGSSSGSGACTSQEAMMTCPDGSQRCCSTNQVCCYDSANGGAIGCEFTGFCQ